MPRFLILLYLLLCSSFPPAMGIEAENAFIAETMQYKKTERNRTATFRPNQQKVGFLSQQFDLLAKNTETALVPQSDSPESDGQQNRQAPIRLKKSLRIGKAMPIPGAVPYFVQEHAHFTPQLRAHAGSTCLLALYCTFRI